MASRGQLVWQHVGECRKLKSQRIGSRGNHDKGGIEWSEAVPPKFASQFALIVEAQTYLGGQMPETLTDVFVTWRSVSQIRLWPD